jgi:hypothetical protein
MDNFVLARPDAASRRVPLPKISKVVVWIICSYIAVSQYEAGIALGSLLGFKEESIGRTGDGTFNRTAGGVNSFEL